MGFDENIKKRVAVLFGILIFAVLLRIDYNSWSGVEFYADTYSYLQIVKDILTKGKIIDGHRTPGYPMFLILNYIFFGHHNHVAVALIQSILGIAGVVVLFFLALQLTKNMVLAALAAAIVSFDYEIIYYDCGLITEAVSTFLVILITYLFFNCVKWKFRLRDCLFLNLFSLALIFIRPIFIMLVILLPIMSVIVYIKDKNLQRLKNMLIPYLVVLIIPIAAWGFALKLKYGFFGMTNVAHFNAMGVLLRYNLYKYAPEEYKEFAWAVEEAQKNLPAEYKRNAYAIFPLIEDMVPRKNEYDYSYLMKFSRACIQSAPLTFLKYSLEKAPEVLTKKEKIRDYKKTGTVMATIGYSLYKNVLYRPYRKGAMGIFLLFFSIFLPLRLCRKNPEQCIELLWILLLIWIQIVLVIFLGPASYARLRMPVDPLINLVVLFGLIEVVLLARRRFFGKDTITSEESTES